MYKKTLQLKNLIDIFQLSWQNSDIVNKIIECALTILSYGIIAVI